MHSLSPTRAPISCRVLPLMIGWFALNVPSGLSLYYFANTVFTAAQQIYLKKLGGGWGRVGERLTSGHRLRLHLVPVTTDA